MPQDAEVLDSHANAAEATAAPSLREIFNREAKQIASDHPKLDGMFVLYDIEGKTASGQLKTERYPWSDEIPVNERTELLNSIVEDLTTRETNTYTNALVRPSGLAVISYAPLDIDMFSIKGEPAEKNILGSVYHELGHIVVTDGMGEDGNYGERAADAYGTLRLIQKYGKDCRAAEVCAFRRALNFVTTGDAEHYTTPTLDEVTALQNVGAAVIMEMSPQKTTEVAENLARKYPPSASTVKAAVDAFAPVRDKLMKTHDVEEAMRVLGETILKDQAGLSRAQNLELFRLGKRVLDPFLSGDADLLYDGDGRKALVAKDDLDNKEIITAKKAPTMEGRKWDALREKLAARETALTGRPATVVKRRAPAPVDEAPAPPAKLTFESLTGRAVDTGLGAVGLVQGTIGAVHAEKRGDLAGVAVNSANAASGGAQVGIEAAEALGNEVAPALKSTLGRANAGLTIATGAYEIAAENGNFIDTTADGSHALGNKGDRTVEVVTTAATGIGLAAAGVGTAGVAASVAAVAYAGDEAVEAHRTRRDADAAVAALAEPAKWDRGGSHPSIFNYKHISTALAGVSPGMHDEALSSTVERDEYGRILISSQTSLDMSDPRNLREFERALDENITKCEKQKQDNSSFLPNWLRRGKSISRYDDAAVELAELTAARTELQDYKKELSAAGTPASPPAKPGGTKMG